MSIKVNTIFKYILSENIYFLILYNNYGILIITLIKISFKIYDKKIAGDCGAGDFFHASAFSNACEKNLAGE